MSTSTSCTNFNNLSDKSAIASELTVSRSLNVIISFSFSDNWTFIHRNQMNAPAIQLYCIFSEIISEKIVSDNKIKFLENETDADMPDVPDRNRPLLESRYYKCTKCDHTDPNPSDIAEHMERIHK